MPRTELIAGWPAARVSPAYPAATLRRIAVGLGLVLGALPSSRDAAPSDQERCAAVGSITSRPSVNHGRSRRS